MSTQRLVSLDTTQRPQGATVATYPTHEVHPVIGASIDQVRQEVDDALLHAKSFFQNEPDQVMRFASGYSARLTHLKVLATRAEDRDPIWKKIRERELEPAIEEMKHQYLIASRLHSVRELDWKIESGDRG